MYFDCTTLSRPTWPDLVMGRRQRSEYHSWIWPRDRQPPGISLTTTFTYRDLSGAEICFENQSRRELEALGAVWIKTDVSEFDTFKVVSPLIAWDLVAKKKRVWDGLNILLDVAKESADWFPPLKSALGGVNALIKHYKVLDELMDATHT